MPSDLHCPHPEPRPAPPYSLGELKPLLEHLRRRALVLARTTYPRGTLQPDGRLDCCKQDLGVEGCRQLAAAIRGHPGLRVVMLGTDAIGDAGATALADILPETPALQSLYLGCNAITPAGVGSLADAIERSPQVRALWLKRNPLGDAGAERLAALLRRTSELRSLDLVQTCLTSAGLQMLVEALLEQPSLECLYVSGNDLGPEVGELLGTLLRSPRSALTSLFLSVNRLGDAGAAELLDGLAQNRQLLELGLGSNGLTAASAGPLARVVREHPTLHRLGLGRSPSTRLLRTADNVFGDEGARELAAGLAGSRALRSLVLSHTGIGDSGQEALAAAIGQSRLVQLELAHPIPQLAAALEANRRCYGPPPPGPPDARSIRSVYR